MTATLRVVMVCTGNICRSPSAEVVLRAQLAAAGLSDRVTVTSAGTGGWHINEPMDDRAAQTLAARGFATGHRARRVEVADLASADLLVAMDRGHLRFLRELAAGSPAAGRIRLLREFDPAAGTDLDVPDPYYGGPEGFERVLDLIEAACTGLVAHLRDLLDAPRVRPGAPLT